MFDPRSSPERPSKSLDHQLADAIRRLNSYNERYLREQIGDEAYDEYVDRNHLYAELDDQIHDEVTALYGTPKERMRSVEDEIAQRLISQGEEPRTAYRYAEEEAVYRYIKTQVSAEDDLFLDAHAAMQTQEEWLFMQYFPTGHYPGLTIGAMQEGLFGFRREMNYEDKSAGELTIGFNLQDDGNLSTEVFYLLDGSPDADTRIERVDVDPGDYDGIIEGIDIHALKRDALLTLERTLRALGSE